MTENNIKHLDWIYNRLINVHKENHNTDYMIRLKSIINKSNTKL